MQIGMIGLGKMGANMVLRLMKDGHDCVVFDLEQDKVKKLVKEGAEGASSFKSFVRLLKKPRVVWLMLPPGNTTEQAVSDLSELMEACDIIIDGGNNYYKNDIRRAKELEKKGLQYLDVGISGGIWGLKEGYSQMVGGRQEIVDYLQPVFETLASEPDRGWGRVGPSGAGHFVKMIHNGIVYGLMQAYAEGFELMNNKKKEFNLDLHRIAEIWRFSSVARSWLLDLISAALEENQTLEKIEAYVPDSGEGCWTLIEAIEQNCSIPVISMSLLRRFRSREKAPFGDKLLAKLRNQFGGHDVKEKK